MIRSSFTFVFRNTSPLPLSLPFFPFFSCFLLLAGYFRCEKRGERWAWSSFSSDWASGASSSSSSSAALAAATASMRWQNSCLHHHPSPVPNFFCHSQLYSKREKVCWQGWKLEKPRAVKGQSCIYMGFMQMEYILFANGFPILERYQNGARCHPHAGYTAYWILIMFGSVVFSSNYETKNVKKVRKIQEA